MKIETKYSVGDKVFPVARSGAEIHIPCPACEGTSEIALVGKMHKCPECYGKGYSFGGYVKDYEVKRPTNVGQVRVQITSPSHIHKTSRDPATLIQYMIESTGVGSGTLWSENDLFASRDEGQAECERRNASGIESTTQFVQQG